MTYTKKERERYNVYRQRVCERLGITKNQYNWLRRKGEALRKLYEDNCNGNIDEFRYLTFTDSLCCDVEIKAHKLGLQVYFQTDPRGATIYLDKQPIPDNNYTQACCIY